MGQKLFCFRGWCWGKCEIMTCIMGIFFMWWEMIFKAFVLWNGGVASEEHSFMLQWVDQLTVVENQRLAFENHQRDFYLSLFCRASQEATIGARKFDINHTTVQNSKILHISCNSMLEENNIISAGNRWVACAFHCRGRGTWYSADFPWWFSWKGIFIYSISNLCMIVLNDRVPWKIIHLWVFLAIVCD